MADVVLFATGNFKNCLMSSDVSANSLLFIPKDSRHIGRLSFSFVKIIDFLYGNYSIAGSLMA